MNDKLMLTYKDATLDALLNDYRHALTAAIREKLPESTLNDAELALHTYIHNLKNPMCSVCAGTGTPVSKKPCICGGTGLERDELRGLRKLAADQAEVLHLVEQEAHTSQVTKCEVCGGVGFTVDAQHADDCDGTCRNCPVPVQTPCERCAPASDAAWDAGEGTSPDA